MMQAASSWLSTRTARERSPRRTSMPRATLHDASTREPVRQCDCQRPHAPRGLGRPERNRDRRLRPYTAKADILPEQTIGRGLRLMFATCHPLTRARRRNRQSRVPQVRRAARAGRGHCPRNIRPEGTTRHHDHRARPDEAGARHLNPDALAYLGPEEDAGRGDRRLGRCRICRPRLAGKPGATAAQTFHYEGYDIITLKKLVERDYTIPEPQSAEEVISYYAKRIAQDLKLPVPVRRLVPKGREFLQTRAFGRRPSTLNEPAMIKAISTSVAQYVTVMCSVGVARAARRGALAAGCCRPGRLLSETPSLPHSRPTCSRQEDCLQSGRRDNYSSANLPSFSRGPRRASFAKLPERFGFAIEYTDSPPIFATTSLTSWQ